MISSMSTNIHDRKYQLYSKNNIETNIGEDFTTFLLESEREIKDFEESFLQISDNMPSDFESLQE
jgi:hypothetical protein